MLKQQRIKTCFVKHKEFCITVLDAFKELSDKVNPFQQPMRRVIIFGDIGGNPLKGKVQHSPLNLSSDSKNKQVYIPDSASGQRDILSEFPFH